ncbi:YozE family protein [Lentilactobacillus laojiaonis]|uniref:YozE family protein n=1 Tax=Lentilactobacillus laojiaonis TaxID=2883998 RepID=UPI001D0A7101|nr:YozE family protein [Lentilactobacillus laojiaonis]UDM31587.1 YozE family protein [Lentilactobacillus laojiaonis]
MRNSFYQFLMTKRNPDSTESIAEFANNAFLDQSFPKQSVNFDEISKYLEENAGYLPSMDIFDDVWNQYQESI